jgi:hypothetical protein
VSWPIALAISIATSIGSLWLSRFVLLRLPADYFVGEEARSRAAGSGRLAWVARNVAALLLVIVGLVLSIPGIPGQGLLLMAVGLVLADLPGKRRLERRLLGHPRVLALINRVRSQAHVALLEPPDRARVQASDPSPGRR